MSVKIILREDLFKNYDVLAKDNLKANEIVLNLNGEWFDEYSEGCVKIDNKYLCDPLIKIMRDSEEPNCEVINMSLVAIRDIEQFEELTLDFKINKL